MQYSDGELEQIAAGESVFPHILGTDHLGRDFAVRVMMGSRISLLGRPHRLRPHPADRLDLRVGRRLLRRMGGHHHDAHRRHHLHGAGHPDHHPAGGHAEISAAKPRRAAGLRLDRGGGRQSDEHLHRLRAALLGRHGAHRAQPDFAAQGAGIRHRRPRARREQRPHHPQAPGSPTGIGTLIVTTTLQIPVGDLYRELSELPRHRRRGADAFARLARQRRAQRACSPTPTGCSRRRCSSASSSSASTSSGTACGTPSTPR